MNVLGTMHVWFWQTPSWNWAELWSLVFLLPFTAFPIDVAKKPGAGGAAGKQRTIVAIGLVNGRDGRWSTSKTTMLLWTYSVWFAFVTILLHTNGAGLEHAVLQQQYLALLGIPAGSAVAAHAITQSKVLNGKLLTKSTAAPETNVIRGFAQLVSNDVSETDLLDFQYFGFNLVLLAYFFTHFLGHQAAGLPDLPDTLVALSGVSAAAYVGKKGVEQDSPPTVRAVVPQRAAPRTTITIRGVNLATAAEKDVAVLVGNLEAHVTSVSVGDYDTTIEATVPPGAARGAATVRVVNYQGVTSATYDLIIE